MWSVLKWLRREPPRCADCEYCEVKTNLGQPVEICMRGAGPDDTDHYCSVERGDYGYADRCGPKGQFFRARRVYADRVP